MSDIANETKLTIQLKSLKFGKRLSNLVIRVFNVLIAFFGLLILFPVLTFFALLIVHESPGPIFYWSLRVGRGGRLFHMYKFRTMREEPASYSGPRITAHDDDRVTPLGAWLRKTKINELPQLWNVLKGDMNLVGPRPEDPEIVATWPEDVRQELLSVQPGITSPASIVYRHEEKLLNHKTVEKDYLSNIVPDKLRLDQLYVRNRSMLTNLDVLLWTAIALLPPLTQTPVPEGLLFVGPFSRFMRRYLSWFVIDVLVAIASFGIIGLIWRANGPLDIGFGVALLVAIAAAVLFSLINSLLGLGRISWKQARPYYVFDLALSVFITTAILFAINWYWSKDHLLPPGMIIEFGIIAFLGFFIVRYRERLITGLASRWVLLRSQTAILGERILIVGAGECGQLACWLIGKSRYASAFSIVGMVDDDPNKHGMKVEGLPVLGATKDIPALVEKKNIGVIMFAISRIKIREQERILKLCRQTPARVVVIPDLLDILETTLFQRTTEKSNDEKMV
jgi:lipopolysaccharide/colanic/teichoic acid biosynthesis glycosyltransferase